MSTSGVWGGVELKSEELASVCHSNRLLAIQM